MNKQITSVFYDANLLPYKDSARTIHYPLVSGTFAGSHNTKEVRFYVRDIGGTNGISWVVVSKLPNGKIGYEVCSNVQYDSELGEQYLSFDLSAYYTQVKGDLYLALRGYQGQITFEDDDNDGVYNISGDPLIEVTGTIKLSINYSPMVNTGTQLLPTDIDRIISALSNYLEIANGIIVTSNISVETPNDYNTNQIFFEYKNDLGTFYYVKETSGVKSFSEITFDSLRTEELRVSDFILLTNNARLYYDDSKLKMTVNGHTLALSTSGVLTIDNNELATKDYVDTNFYNKTDSDTRYIDQTVFGMSGATPSGTFSASQMLRVQRADTVIKRNNKYYYKITSPTGQLVFNHIEVSQSDNVYTIKDERITITTSNGHWEYTTTSYNAYTKDGVDNLISTLKANTLQQVDITTYPTLNSFLASTGEEGIIYLYPIDTSESPLFQKGFYRYTWENNGWLSLGTTQIDLSNYVDLTSSQTIIGVKTFANLPQSSMVPSNENDFVNKNYVDIGLSGKQDTLVSGTNIKTLNGESLLGSGNIEYDDEFSEVSTNAVENRVISLAVKEINYELAVIRESLFEVLLTELDYKVSYAMSYAIPDTLSDSDGTHRVVYSETQLKSVEGNGVVLNQNVLHGLFTTGNTTNWIFYTTNGSWSTDNVCSTWTCNRENALNIQVLRNQYDVFSWCAGHKAILIADLKSNRENVKLGTYYLFTESSYLEASPAVNANQWNTVYCMGTLSSSANDMYFQYLMLRNVSFTTDDIVSIKNLQLIDLTLMFGAGNEPTTTDDNRIQWLLSQGYIPYNTGSLDNTTISGVKLIGNNKFDGELEQGALNSTTGLPEDSSSGIRSKNYIKVIRGKQYSYNITSLGTLTPTNYILYEYDTNKSFIKRTVAYSNNYSFTLDNNTQYIKFCSYSSSGNSLTGVEVSVYLTGNNIGYKPYTETTISIPQTTLLGAINSHDTISVVEGNVVEGEQLYNIVHTSNVGTKDLGSIGDWTYDGRDHLKIFYTSYLKNRYGGPNTSGTKPNIVCYKYVTVNNQLEANMSSVASGSMFLRIGSSTPNRLCIRDDSFNGDTSAFINALNGVMLQYQLATPTQTIVAQDLHFDQVSSIIEQGGTIEPIFEDVPPNLTTTFVVKKAVGE